MMTNRTSLILLLSLFLGGLAWGLLPDEMPILSTPTAAVSTQPQEVSKEQIQTELGSFARLAKELKPSVVNISVVKSSPDDRAWGRRLPQPDRTGQGSGVIISQKGEILTNNHVVQGAKIISVKLADGRELKAEIVGTDSNTDLALLRTVSEDELPVARLGDSDQLSVGDWMMAIGNPFGLEATVTVGVLSGKGRVIGAGPYDDFLQTDASINPGNSGGPLFNTQGEVVGINTAIIPGGQGIGFSIPINLAKDVAAQLRTKGRVVRGFIGVGVQPLTPALRSALKLPKESKGALVASIMPDGPAQDAGIDVRDLIVSVNNHRVSSDRELLSAVAKLEVGKEVPFTVYRSGEERTVFIRIVERPSREMSANVSPPKDSNDQPRLGVAVQDLPSNDGVLIASVQPNSKADRAGIKTGDIVRSVGRQTPISAQNFVDLVTETSGDLALLIERQGRTEYIVVAD